MSAKKTLELLLKKINDANSESIKASSYSDGYIDCIKDILNHNLCDLSDVIRLKHDGEIRTEVYSEVMPVIQKAINEIDAVSAELKQPALQSVIADESFLHPQERTRSFLERICRR